MTTFLLSLLFFWGATYLAQEPPAETTQIDLKSFSCADFLEILNEDEGRSEVFVVWAHGYSSGVNGLDLERPLGRDRLEPFAQSLIGLCRSGPERTFVEAVRQTSD